jgi:hypothetical protein
MRGDTGRRRATCRECDRAANRTRYHSRPETKLAHQRASRKHYLNKLYGLTTEEYDAMLKARDFRCDICGESEQQDRSLAVDHCHRTGKVRGLLCQACNTAIGKLRDDPSLIRRAASYVERHS